MIRGCAKLVAWGFSPAAAAASQTRLARQIDEIKALSCSFFVSFLGPVGMIASVTRTSGSEAGRLCPAFAQFKTSELNCV